MNIGFLCSGFQNQIYTHHTLYFRFSKRWGYWLYLKTSLTAKQSWMWNLDAKYLRSAGCTDGRWGYESWNQSSSILLLDGQLVTLIAFYLRILIRGNEHILCLKFKMSYSAGDRKKITPKQRWGQISCNRGIYKQKEHEDSNTGSTHEFIAAVQWLQFQINLDLQQCAYTFLLKETLKCLW